MQFVIMRMPRTAELEIFVVCRQRVAVEHDLDIAAIARGAPEQLMLPALAEFPQVGERSIRRRHAGIVFLDPPAHFRHQLLLQGRGMAEQALGVVVFRFQVFPDIRVEDRRIAQHLLPFGVFQPSVIVRYRDAVRGEGVRAARGDRWRQGGFLGGSLGHAGSSYGSRIEPYIGLNVADYQMRAHATKPDLILRSRVSGVSKDESPGLHGSRRRLRASSP